MRDWAIPTALLAAKVETAGEVLALAIVAGHWNTETRVAHPGTRRVALLSKCSQSAAARRLANLVASGDLVVDRAGHGNYSTRYRVPALENGPVPDPDSTGTSPLERVVQPVNESPKAGRTGGSARLVDAERVVRPSERVANESPKRGSEVVRDEVDLARVRAREERTAAPPPASDLSGSADDDATVLRRYLDAIARDPEPEPLPHATDDERDRVNGTLISLRDSLGFRARKDPS